MNYYDDADVFARHLVSALQYMLRHSVLAIKGVKDAGDGDRAPDTRHFLPCSRCLSCEVCL